MSNAPPHDDCPRCGQKGKKVKAITVDSHVSAAAKAKLGSLDGFRFCATSNCANAYFQPEDGVIIDKKHTRFPIFQKETTPERLVCYCFQHSVQEISAEVSSAGGSKVIQEIKESCKRGMDDCARNNPQGSCCLGNVSKVVKAAKGRSIADSTTEIQDCCHADAPGNDSESDCSGGKCENETVGVSKVEMKTRHGSQFAISGGVLAAVASSACCWLPLLLIGTGISTTSAAGFFESYRFIFVTGSLMLLATGFYLVYFRKIDCAECAIPDARMRLFTRSMLWIATVMIAAFTLFPNALSVWANSREPGDTAFTQSVNSQQLVFAIEGMTCAACSVQTETAILAVPGVNSVTVDYDSKLAQILAEDFVSAVAVEKAVSKLGYVATEIEK